MTLTPSFRFACVFTCCLAGNFSFFLWASDQHSNRDPKAIIAQSLEEAKKGEAKAQFAVADAYSRLQKREEAIYWFSKAAEHGHAEAQYRLSQYFGGDKRVVELQKAAKMGSVNGQIEYSSLAYRLRKIDYKEHIDWIEKAADAGHIGAQYDLARIYLHIGVSSDEAKVARKDASKSLSWYLRVAKNNNLEEKYRLTQTRAQFQLGQMYYNGIGIAKDATKAFEWYLVAAQRGHLESMWTVSKMFASGDGTAADQKQADEWATKASSIAKKVGPVR